MKKLGILLPNLGPNQASFYAITSANQLFGRTDIDISLFYQELCQPCVKPLCGSFSSTEVWSFDGILITSNINTTMQSISATSPRRRLFYIWDLEWIRLGNQNFLYNISAYRSPLVELIVRSESHIAPIQQYANRQVNAVIPDFNIKYILDYLEKTHDTATK